MFPSVKKTKIEYPVKPEITTSKKQMKTPKNATIFLFLRPALKSLIGGRTTAGSANERP